MIRIEGYTPGQLLDLPVNELDELVFIGRPLVVRVGSADVLAECQRRGNRLVVDLAHIDGGGEGALPTLTRFIEGSLLADDSSTLTGWYERRTVLDPMRNCGGS